MINLGDEAKDKVSGFQGIAVAITLWLNGCRRITLQSQALDKDGKVMDGYTFDEPQLEVITAGKVAFGNKDVTKPADRNGGPRPEPKQRKDPQRV